MKRNQAKPAVTVQHFNWGAIFTGTKAALIRAKLAKPEHFKPKVKGYTLPLNHKERYMAAVFGPNRGPIPPSWDADIQQATWEGKGYFDIRVHYSVVHDLNIRERAAQAAIALRTALAMVEAIPPVSLAKQLGVEAEEVTK